MSTKIDLSSKLAFTYRFKLAFTLCILCLLCLCENREYPGSFQNESVNSSFK